MGLVTDPDTGTEPCMSLYCVKGTYRQHTYSATHTLPTPGWRAHIAMYIQLILAMQQQCGCQWWAVRAGQAFSAVLNTIRSTDLHLQLLSRVTLIMSNTGLCCCLQNTMTSQWPRPLVTKSNLFILGSKWTFVLNLMKLALMKVLQRYRGDKNVMDRWYDSSRRSCGRHRGIKHLYAFLFMCISWSFDDGENSVALFCIIGTYLVDSQSFNPGCVCLCEPSLSARSQPRWLNVSECHTNMIARSPQQKPAHRQQQSTTC